MGITQWERDASATLHHALCDMRLKLTAIRRDHGGDLPDFIRDELESLIEHVLHLDKPLGWLLAASISEQLPLKPEDFCGDCRDKIGGAQLMINGRVLCRSCFDRAVARSEVEA